MENILVKQIDEAATQGEVIIMGDFNYPEIDWGTETCSSSKGSVPQDWRIANVVPIFKKGTKTELGNYRPVSLTSTVGKILEGILRDAILEYLKRNNLMTQYQHGFTRDRSCQTNLISFYEERMSVITQIIGESNMTMFMKGAPEMVVCFCKPETVPDNFSEKLDDCTVQGFRVIGLACRSLQKEDLPKSFNTDRSSKLEYSGARPEQGAQLNCSGELEEPAVDNCSVEAEDMEVEHCNVEAEDRAVKHCSVEAEHSAVQHFSVEPEEPALENCSVDDEDPEWRMSVLKLKNQQWRISVLRMKKLQWRISVLRLKNLHW
ncbi:unnamed protein product [Ranitomeya imitator]|uniref:Reverse transcriptase n=1 Tax=Ranitomeya imitator TaxID=111125 RepID=A0ABN9MDE7_9NEOB|nr:unnamed protein product [Ranitomeya imitator]